MVKVNFYINDKVVLAESFDEQPIIKADYVFDGIKYQVSSVTTNDDGSFNYHLLIAAETDVYDIKNAHQILTADDNSDVIMPDGQAVPSVAKVIKLVDDVDAPDYWKGFFKQDASDEQCVHTEAPILEGVYRTDGIQADDVEKPLAVIELRQKVKNTVRLMSLLKSHPASTYGDMQHLDDFAKETDAKAANIFYSLPMNMQYALHNFDN